MFGTQDLENLNGLLPTPLVTCSSTISSYQSCVSTLSWLAIYTGVENHCYFLIVEYLLLSPMLVLHLNDDI